MNMKGMNPYQHFGFRQAWLEHYMNDGVSCFSKEKLGKLQYASLKVWLRESNLLITNKDKSLSETTLFEKIKNFGPYNPFTWAVIWANLAYNSVITKWYCLNAEPGATYEKGDLVVMLGDSYSKSNRENAVTALTETLRFSPIGAALNQGLPLELTKNTYAYLREGWEYPDGVVLLYSLYLYAEHVNRKELTFTELANARNNPDAKGLSPHEIYGIDVKDFREMVQALAVSYPDYIRVSFIANLDNIILGDFTSTDILDLVDEDDD